MLSSRRADRGVSEVVGFILIATTIMIGISVILLYGGYTVSEMKHDATTEHAENAFTGLDRTITTVALSDTATQTEYTFGFSNSHGGGLALDTRGTINISLIESDGTVVPIIPDTQLGAIIYENSGTRIVYQNGGVWKTNEATQSRQLVSTPEMTTTGGTLSVSVIRVAPSTQFTGDTLYLSNTQPSNTASTTLSSGETLRITIQSEYYRQWGAYAKLTLNGAEVSYDTSTNTVTIEFPSKADGGAIKQVYISNATVGN